MSSARLADLLRALKRGLTTTGGRWYLFGARAAMAHGLPRYTGDVDLTVCNVNANVVLAALHPCGFSMRRGIGGIRFIRETRVIPMIHTSSGVPIDVVLGGPGLEEAFAERAQRRMVAGVQVPVLSAEDLIVTKLLAGRAKDLDDIRGVLGRQGRKLRVDRVRSVLHEVEQALGHSDLSSLFERLLSEHTSAKRKR